MNLQNPLIVQGDRTLLLDVHAPLAKECRNDLLPFAELERSPEHLHTYRLTPLSLWNATSAGFTAQNAVEVLQKYARYDVPQSVIMWITETAGRFGKLRLVPGPVRTVPLKTEDILKSEPQATPAAAVGATPAAVAEGTTNANSATDSNQKIKTVKEEYVYLVANSRTVYLEISASPSVKKLLTPCKYDEADIPPNSTPPLTEDERQFCFLLKLTDRGTVKQELLRLLWPVKDDIQLKDGEPLDFSLLKTTAAGKPFEIREYQKEAATALIGNKGPGTGFGTIVLPCGAGKTIVGMQIMELLKTNTLIITTNISAVHQWINELLDKTNLTSEQIAEYTGENKTLAPVTVATYQILTWRPEKDGPYPHFSIFKERNWGLIIYDEVHMLPAPVFRVVAELQAVRRVGLTATLVREDGCEGFVFSLVGPKRYDVPWKELEQTGWIAKAECVELRIDLPESQEIQYAVAEPREKHKLASMNEQKAAVAAEIVRRFPDDKILIIGQYLEQLHSLAEQFACPIITGKTPNAERDRIYSDFRSGKIHVLVVSKVANFAIDLPDASIAIQVSGTFGSRQEEAQRLGRILRPKERMSRFFTLITRNTVEEDFGSNRQKFLAEQGYSYRIIRYTNESDLDELFTPQELGFDGRCV